MTSVLFRATVQSVLPHVEEQGFHYLTSTDTYEYVWGETYVSFSPQEETGNFWQYTETIGIVGMGATLNDAVEDYTGKTTHETELG